MANLDEFVLPEENFIPNIADCHQELLMILGGIIECYELMINEITNLPNDENAIRDVIVENYLKIRETRIKFNLNQFIFEGENRKAKTDKLNDKGKYPTIRYDITIKNKNHTDKTDNFQYLIECKRLDGKVGQKVEQLKNSLNSEYVHEGIDRFLKEEYRSEFFKGGQTFDEYAMLGFCVASFDIAQNIEKSINTYLDPATTEEKISRSDWGYSHTYRSQHRSVSNKKITIYHAMLDFSKQIR